jgi:protein disulfide-isomerase A6
MGLLRSVFVASLAILGSNAVSAVIDLIPSNFDDVVLKSGKPSLVEFFAPWCGRKCLLVIPMIVTISKVF